MNLLEQLWGGGIRSGFVPFRADQWYARTQTLAVASAGAGDVTIPFGPNASPVVLFNGQASVPEGFQGIVRHVRCALTPFFDFSDPVFQHWRLERNGVAVPGYDRGYFHHAIPHSYDFVDFIAGTASLGCAAGCDYSYSVPLRQDFMRPSTGTPVIAPVWLSPGDSLRVIARDNTTAASIVECEIGGLLWPIEDLSPKLSLDLGGLLARFAHPRP